MVLSRDPCPAPTAHQCCLRLQCQHSGLCVAQWAQLFPLTPRAHVTKAHREWERDRHPDICLCRLRDMQTYKHCRDTGSLQKSKPTHRDARVQLVVRCCEGAKQNHTENSPLTPTRRTKKKNINETNNKILLFS